MALDQELIRAVNESVLEVGYPSPVALRINKWLEEQRGCNPRRHG